MEDDKVCDICCEEKEDLRMMPCWHVACFLCILGMTQTGRGRALSCHACREPFLFENIRSLPQPIKCEHCSKFLKSPRKFSCCSRLYCLECIRMLQNADENSVSCPASCTESRYGVENLVHPKICCICFRLYDGNEDNGVNHSYCSSCTQDLSRQKRECPLCIALKSQFPIPIKPIQSSELLGDVDAQTIVDQGQPISQMHLISALQTVRLWQHRNVQQRHVHHGAQQSEIRAEMQKAAIFLINFSIMGYFHGFDLLTWIVCGSVLILTKPSNGLCFIINSVLLLISIITAMYYHFWMFILLVVFEILILAFQIQTFIRPQDSQVWKWLPFCVKYLAMWWYCPPIFLHNQALAVFSLILIGRMKR